MIEYHMMHYHSRVSPDTRDHWCGTRIGCGVMPGRGTADDVG